MAIKKVRDGLDIFQVAHKVESWALAHHPNIPGLCVSGDERGVAMAAGGLAGGSLKIWGFNVDNDPTKRWDVARKKDWGFDRCKKTMGS